jgi:hypothetical protein
MRKNDFLWRSVASARQSALFPFQNQDQGSRGNRTRRRIRQSGRFLGLAPAAAMSNSPSIDVARQALRVANRVAGRVALRVALPAPTPPDMRVRIRRFRLD